MTQIMLEVIAFGLPGIIVFIFNLPRPEAIISTTLASSIFKDVANAFRYSILPSAVRVLMAINIEPLFQTLFLTMNLRQSLDFLFRDCNEGVEYDP